MRSEGALQKTAGLKSVTEKMAQQFKSRKPALTAVPEDLAPSSGACGHCMHMVR